ncbi:MAG: T9SS type A sorting domain-containing protein [Paludibacter sp.]
MKQRMKWGLIFILFLTLRLSAQNNYTLQYWFNNDFSSVKTLGFNAANNQFTQLSVPTNTILYGANKINCRVLDSNNIPSAVWYFYFVKEYFSTSKQTVFEYWFDDHYDNIFRSTVTDSLLTFDLNTSIKDLSLGLHTIHIRTGFLDGFLTAPQTSYFVKLSNGNPSSLLEYWFDYDIAHKIQYRPGGCENMIELNLNVLNLATGTHKLNVRAGNEKGLLSPITTSFFFKGIDKYAIPVTGSKVVNYRYWFDDDKANMVTGTISDITQEITFLKVINANTLEKGQHNVSIQFQNSLGQWSDVAYGEFNKKGNKVIGIPQLITNRTIYLPGERVSLSGLNFTSYGKLQIEYNSNNVTKIDTLYANKAGKFESGITLVNPGQYLIKATDLTTQLSNSGFYVKVLPITAFGSSLKLLYPATKGNKISLGDSIYVRWTDKLVLDRRYNLNPANATRSYQYSVEIDSIDGRKMNESGLAGDATINSVVNFTTSYLPKFSGQYKFKITDAVTKNIIGSESIEVVNNTGLAIVKKEWDYSIQTKNGNYNRVGTPKGVAADGTGRIYLTVESKVKKIKSVTVTLDDGVNTTPDLLGKLMPATVTDKFSNEANSAKDISVTNQSFSNKLWFWYVAPDDFADGKAINNTRSTRTVNAKFEITYDDFSVSTEVMPLEIVRPSIMLVHGLGGSAERTWGDFTIHNTTPLMRDTVYKVVQAINLQPAVRFERNAVGLFGENEFMSIADNFYNPINTLRSQGYSSNRIDYICHSMGGNILRYAVEHFPAKFYADRNYGKGYTNKVIMLNTPNEGSPFADAVSLITDVVNMALDTQIDLKLGKVSVSDILSLNNILEDDYTTNRMDNSYFNIYNYIRPFTIEQPSDFQSTVNFWASVFGKDYQTKPVRKYDRTPAVQDLSINDGVRFNQVTNVRAHLIAGDLIPWIQNFPTITPIESKVFENYMKYGKSAQQFLDYLEKALDLIDRLQLTDKLKMLHIKDPVAFHKRVIQIKNIADKNVKYTELFDEVLKDINQIIAAGNIASFALDCDLFVSVNSQLTGSYQNLNNHTIFNGINANHLSIVTNKDVETRIETLLNSSIKSDLFNGIPAYVAPTNYVKKQLVEPASIQISKSNAAVDSTKLQIVSPASSTIIFPNDMLEVRLAVKDTANLDYVELRFQGETYRDFSKEQNVVFNIPVSGELLNDQKLLVSASYYYSSNDSSFTAYAGRIINVTPRQVPISFSCNDKVIYLHTGDTISTSYDVIYPDFIYSFSSDKNVTVNIDNQSKLIYNSNYGYFVSKNPGNTFAEVNYGGLKDTIYFVLDGKSDVATSIPNTMYTNNKLISQNFSVYPNPAKSFTTITSSENINRIEICDISGRIIQYTNINSTNYKLDIGQLAKGVYLIKGFTNGGVKIGRFVKE